MLTFLVFNVIVLNLNYKRILSLYVEVHKNIYAHKL